MPDYSNPNSLTFIFGKSGSCKTSFAFSYLLNSGRAPRGSGPAAAVFIFDDRGQAAARLGIPTCGTEQECEAALATGWVCFNPHIRYPGADIILAFCWFCAWAFYVSKRGPGRKILFIDEIWQWSTSRTKVPVDLENIVRTGRTEGLELVVATHSPSEVHQLVRSQTTEFVAFNTIEPAQLDAIRPYWPGVDAAAKLTKGQFLSFNRDSGEMEAGMMEPGWPPGKFVRVT
jgi:hypothetical protein